jgi:hypothetical protein
MGSRAARSRDRWGTTGRTEYWQKESRLTLHLYRTRQRTACGVVIIRFSVPKKLQLERVCGNCARIRRAEYAAGLRGNRK